MNMKFSIRFSCTEETRPPISEKIGIYLSNFVIKNVLEPKDVLINAKWDVILSILFVGEGKRGGPDTPFLAKGARILTAENTKIYEMLVPLKLIDLSHGSALTTIELLYQSLKLFLVSTYKKITSEFLDSLWQKVDLNYLLSLPYPAPGNEQKFVGDK